MSNDSVTNATKFISVATDTGTSSVVTDTISDDRVINATKSISDYTVTDTSSEDIIDDVDDSISDDSVAKATEQSSRGELGSSRDLEITLV